MGKVVMYSTVSVDGFIADENDQPGPLFDWLTSGDVPLDETGQLKVSQASYDHTRAYWDQIAVTIAGRHVFDLTDGWGGTPPSGIDHVVVVSHRPAPDGWSPEAPFLPMPAAELCDRPVTLEDVWGRPTVAELRDRLATAAGPHEMLTLLEDQLMRMVCETAGLGLVRHTSSVIAAATGAVAIGELSVAAGVSSTHLAQRFKEVVGVTPKRLARAYRFTATVLAIDPTGPVDWAELAARAGYYDQAHFGHDFRAFTGLTPTRYLDVRRRFLREHPGHVLDVGPLPAD